jgi:hypothetical protein
VDDVVLRYVAQQVPERIEVRVQVDPVEQNGAPVGRANPGQRLQQHGLSSAASADDGHQLPRTDR